MAFFISFILVFLLLMLPVQAVAEVEDKGALDARYIADPSMEAGKVAIALAGAPAEKTPVPFMMSRPVWTAPPPRLQAVFSREDSPSYQAAMNALREIEPPFSSEEKRTFLAFLYRNTGEANLPAAPLNALKNHIVNMLKTESDGGIPLIRHLMTLYHDLSQDPVWREYCVQHLGTLYANAQMHQPALIELFDHALAQRKGSLAGTALLAMRQNQGRAPFSAAHVAACALAVASSADYDAASRATALQVAAQQDDPNALRLARMLLADEAEGVLVHVSAAAVIGRLGDGRDRMVLESLAASSDARLRGAAHAAQRAVAAKQ